jgi:hypothetical protein
MLRVAEEKTSEILRSAQNDRITSSNSLGNMAI